MSLDKIIEGLDERISTISAKLLIEDNKDEWDELFAMYEMAWHLRTAMVGWQ